VESQGKPLPPIWIDRQNTGSQSLVEQNAVWIPRQKLMNCWRSGWTNLRETPSLGKGTPLYYLQEPHLLLTVSSEKNPSLSQQEKKETIRNIPDHSVLNKSLTYKSLIYKSFIKA
jgi:hypothetical protein